MQPDVERVAVTVDGHEVAVDVHLRAAEGPPVVFLHGLLTSSRLARRLFEDPAGESWVAVSLPGHHPGRLAAGTRPADLDADLFAVLIDAALARVLGSGRVVATGWSTGGFAALNLAIRRPERVAAVACLAGFASGRRITGSITRLAWLAQTSAGRAVLRGGLWAGGRMQWLHDAIMRTATAGATAAHPLDDATRATLWRDFRSHKPAELATALAALPSLEITSRLGEITAPTWIVAGGCDPLVPFDEARRLASAIRGATLTVYDPGGHLFFHEWPDFRRDFADWRAGLADSQR